MRSNIKVFKITYPFAELFRRFPKDIVGLILDFMWVCDECCNLEIGRQYFCEVCSPDMILCKECYDLKSLSDHFYQTTRCYPCEYCGMIHCSRKVHYNIHNFWTDCNMVVRRSSN